jgi:hypothetical protein
MSQFLKIVRLFFDFVVFVLFAAFIGLWWTPEFIRGTQGGYDGSLLRATGVLVVAAIMFYKEVVVLSRHHTHFHLYFYIALAIGTVASYSYGIVFRWQ